jgi:filamentous hemagglutinin
LGSTSVSSNAAETIAGRFPSVGAARPTTRILQTGGNTIQKGTAKALNEALERDLHARDWGRALEALKKAEGLPNNHHG